MEHAVARMAAMIDDLLELSRAESGHPLRLRRRPVDLVALLRREVETLRRASGRHNLRFVSAFPALVGQWDEVRLERVVGNLLSNAIKYSPEGGEVRITVAREEEDGRPFAVLRVRDRGIGIPAADLPRVFEPFYRASNADGQVPGSGIGLAGAQRLVAAHGGALTVDSEEGEGTTFLLIMPLDDTGKATAEAAGGMAGGLGHD
jgi:signal transduction histidine kinase